MASSSSFFFFAAGSSSSLKKFSISSRQSSRESLPFPPSSVGFSSLPPSSSFFLPQVFLSSSLSGLTLGCPDTEATGTTLSDSGWGVDHVVGQHYLGGWQGHFGA